MSGIAVVRYSNSCIRDHADNHPYAACKALAASGFSTLQRACLNEDSTLGDNAILIHRRWS